MPTLTDRRPLLLELDLTEAPVESEPGDVVAKLRTRNRPRLRAVLRALHEAGDDRRVRGLVVKIGGGTLPWATMQELRAGLRAFAATGKPVVGWAESLGEGGNGTADCVLASGCTQMWLQPTGEVALLGVAAETTFLRGALDKLGVEPQLDKRYEYKSAADRIMNTEFTEAHREALDRVVESTWDGAVDAIAAGRDLSPERVQELSTVAPMGAEQARDAGLVDRLGYRDEVYADVRERAGGDDVRLLFADRWTPRRKPAAMLRRHRDVVALVEGHGQIVVGRSRPTPGGGARMGSATVSAALRAARTDEHVRAVVFRVDSPGGSGVASDTIWREVSLLREAGKPVVVSMGSLAGSGGYFVACPADVIVAQPATITGSIGVLGGKVVVAQLLERLGLTTGTVMHGGSAQMFSLREGFSDDERARLGAMLDRVYDDFVAKVAQGRGMSVEAVDAVARGRIWSGADAARNGLVDELGGLRAATALARSRAGLKPDAPLRPALHVAPLDRLRRPISSEDPRAASVTSGWGDLRGLAQALGLSPAGPLAMPEFRLR
ncbi:signal peptide peptidase SppA [uncultured Jatrophihabitans sp.]|uniref:signal peptide peptidase SppA n=1 Tax=uncultured Jatrophihabitans sp. TaxID=1610747 RepID=UPI0035C94E32